MKRGEVAGKREAGEKRVERLKRKRGLPNKTK